MNKTSTVDRVPEFAGEDEKRYQALVALRDELNEQVASLSDSSLGYRKEAGEDLADIGSENFSRDVGLHLMSEEGSKVVLIHDAIQRLVDGTYGQCIDCGKQIGEARLEAIPYAKLCVECKGEWEANGGVSPREEVEDQVVE
jgi:DnaK suppressor protein